MQLNGGTTKNRSKRTQVQYIKMSHNRSTMAVKIREKNNLSGTSFFNNIETPSAKKISTHGILASKFPSSSFLETNALNKLFVLFTEESWSIPSLMS